MATVPTLLLLQRLPQRSVESAATEAAAAEQDAAVLAATAEFEAPYLARLSEYGLAADQGQLAWVHPPVAVEIDGYLQYDYVNQRIATVVQDFMLEADVTWNTVTGLSGCGFAVRASITEGATEEDNTFTGYLLIASRIDTGRAGFGVLVDNEPVAGEELYARGVDRSFDWQNDGTNRIGIVGIGNTFIFYTNGTEIGRFSAPPDYLFDKGFVAMVGLSESGRTLCQFDNTWLWLIDSGAVSPPPLGTVVGPPPAINAPQGDFPIGLICGLPFVPICP